MRFAFITCAASFWAWETKTIGDQNKPTRIEYHPDNRSGSQVHALEQTQRAAQLYWARPEQLLDASEYVDPIFNLGSQIHVDGNELGVSGGTLGETPLAGRAVSSPQKTRFVIQSTKIRRNFVSGSTYEDIWDRVGLTSGTDNLYMTLFLKVAR